MQVDQNWAPCNDKRRAAVADIIRLWGVRHNRRKDEPGSVASLYSKVSHSEEESHMQGTNMKTRYRNES
jgi:hypothetical protein